MQAVRLLSNRYRVLKDLFHVPNEGKRAPMVAFDLGIKAGVPDYCCPWPTSSHHGFWLEVKDGGKPTRAQEDMIEQLQAAGHLVMVSYNLDEAIFYTEQYAKLAEAKRRKDGK